MTSPIKRTGFSQGIYVVSATAKERVGTLRILQDGRKFRYSKAGASALSAGLLGMAADIAANVKNINPSAAAAVGAKSVAVTAGGAVTYAANYFEGGYLHINDAAGEGHIYEIEASTAVAAGTAINVQLKDPIQIALTTSSEVTLVHNPNMAVIESADEENLPVGVAMVAVTAAYFYWAQIAGPCSILCSGTIAVFDMVTPGATAGSAKTIASWSTTTDPDMPIIGQAMVAGVDTEQALIRLNLP